MEAKPQEQYPSANLSFQVILHEYELECNRTSIIDSKTGIIITLAAAYLVIVLKEFDFLKYLQLPVNTASTALMPLLLVFLNGGAIVLAVLSLLFLLIAVMPRDYQFLNYDDLLEKELLTEKPDIISVLILQNYIEIIYQNKGVNDKRAVYYRTGLLLLFASIVALFSYKLLTNLL